MADTDTDPYAYLLKMVEHSGPQLALLFRPKNLKAAAELLIKAEHRYRHMESMLKAFKWPERVEWSRQVANIAKTSAEDSAKAKIDEAKEAALDEARAEGLPVLRKGRPVEIAEAFRKEKRPHIIHWAEDWLAWQDNRYVQLEPGAINAEVQAFMHSAVDADSAEAFVVGPREVEHVVSALKNVTFQTSGAESLIALPMWLDPAGYEPPAKQTVALKNGLLGVVNKEFMKPSPDFFTRNSLPFNYNPDATCPMWLNFLASIEDEREGWIDNLQEIMGYLISPFTDLQKMFAFYGKGGSGKGVIVRIISALVGEKNTMARTFESMFGSAEGRFSKEDLFHASLIVFGDVVVQKHHLAALRQFILSTVGEDAQSSDRKGKSRIYGKLNARVIWSSNHYVIIADHGGEIKRRMFPIRFTLQFRDSPLYDKDLPEKLLTELEGIFNWCLVGLNRLLERGDFEMCPDTKQLLEHISMLSAPVSTFLTAITEEAPYDDASVGALWRAYNGWHYAARGEEPWIRDIGEFKRTMETVTQIEAQRRGGDFRLPIVFPGIRIKPEFVKYRWPTALDDDDEGAD